MRYIAIIQTADTGCYECDGDMIIRSITDWKEVTEEDFQLLLKLSQKSFNWKSKIPQFKVLERPSDEENFILQVIADYKGLIEEEAKREAEAKRKRQIAAAKRAKTVELNKINAVAKKKELLLKQLARLELEEKA